MNRLHRLHRLSQAEQSADLAMERAILAMADGRRDAAATALEQHAKWTGRVIELASPTNLIDLNGSERVA